MPEFGGFSYLHRGGGETPRSLALTLSLNNQMGTAYDTESQASPVYIRNLALARCIGDVWDTNERMANQFDPLRMTDMLPRWEKILKLPVNPGDTMATRRRRVAARFARFGKKTLYQRLYDVCLAFLDPITFTIIGGDSATASINWPDNWIEFWTPESAGAVVLSGIATEPLDVVIHILSTGIVGAATFQFSLDGMLTWNGPYTTSASYSLGSGLTAEFIAGTHTAGDMHFYYAGPQRWMSSTAHTLISCTQPSGMTDAEYYLRVGELSAELDQLLPIWMTFDVARDGSSPGEFILDDDHNLDNETLST